MLTYTIEDLWEKTGYESDIPFVLDLLLHEIPICLLSSDNPYQVSEFELPSFQNDKNIHFYS